MAIITRKTAVPAVKRWQTFSTIGSGPGQRALATCEQAGCLRWRRGWVVRLDEDLRLGRIRADYIRHVTNRRGWTETRSPEGVTVFTFPPGTPCFCDGRDHRARAVFDVTPHTRQVRPMLHVVSAGPSAAVAAQIARTGRPAEVTRTHTRPQDWAEHAAESWNSMADAINR
jgi:hypothetical protein